MEEKTPGKSWITIGFPPARTLISVGMLFYVLLSSLEVSGQSPFFCGVSSADQYLWMERYTSHLRNYRQGQTGTRSLTAVPVAFHLTGRTNGDGMPPEWQAWATLCDLNTVFAGTNFHFYLAHVSQTPSTGIFNDHTLNINQQAMRALKRNDAMNVFVVNNASSPGGNAVAGYFDVQDDWIVVARSTFRAGNHTTAHEAGHFFSLFHPHFGWDGQAWSAAIHGNPAPATASDGITLTERQDGSNCQTAGDQLCDTPPDYNFGLTWQQSCSYTGGAQDPAGTVVNPDESLVMSYFNDSCRSVFSLSQLALMQADLADPARTYLQTSFIPQPDTHAVVTQLLNPSGNAFLNNNAVEFQWSNNVAADRYYLEVDRSPAFNLEPKGTVTSDTTLAFSYPFVAGVTYYWRIFAYSPHQACMTTSSTFTFQAQLSSSVEPEHAGNGFQVFQQGETAILKIFQTQTQPYHIRILSIEGKTCREWSGIASAGKSEINFGLDGMVPGLYFLIFDGNPAVGKLLVRH